MTARREALFKIIAVALGVLVPLVAIEMGFRLLPTMRGLWRVSIDASQTVAHYRPSQPMVWSVGASLEHPNRGRINNFGFVNDQDYAIVGDARPLLAVIGDSFVEATLVPYPSTLHGRLARFVGSQGRVYSFGMSGAPLSQYAAYARFARDNFKPSALVVSVVSNDFDECVPEVHEDRHPPYQGFHYYRLQGGELREWLLPLRVSRTRRLIESSAFLTYLTVHAKIQQRFARTLSADAAQPALHVAPSSALETRLRTYYEPAEFEPWPERRALSQRAVDKFLGEVEANSGLPPSRILFVVDAMRVGIEAPRLAVLTSASFFGHMRGYFIEAARRHGYEVVDLQEPMRAFVAATGKPLDFSHDDHWNRDGHGIVANEILQSKMFRSVFPKVAGP